MTTLAEILEKRSKVELKLKETEKDLSRLTREAAELIVADESVSVVADLFNRTEPVEILLLAVDLLLENNQQPKSDEVFPVLTRAEIRKQYNIKKANKSYGAIMQHIQTAHAHLVDVASWGTMRYSGLLFGLAPSSDYIRMGKYKGKARSVMLRDRQYCAWVWRQYNRGEASEGMEKELVPVILTLSKEELADLPNHEYELDFATMEDDED